MKQLSQNEMKNIMGGGENGPDHECVVQGETNGLPCCPGSRPIAAGAVCILDLG